MNSTYPAIFQALQSASLSPFQFTFTDNTQLTGSSNPPDRISYGVSWQSVNGTSYYLSTANGPYAIASSASAGNLPFFPLTSAGQATITLPFIPTNSCNIFVAVGTAPTIPLNGLSPPTPPTSYYDIVEFTLDASGVATTVPPPYEHLPTLNIDTSQVTQFGMPLEVTGQTTTSQSTSVGVSPGVNRATFFTAYTNFVNATAPGPMSAPSPYVALIVNNPAPGSPPPFGILNPTEYIRQGKDTTGQFAPVFNTALVHLFEQQNANPAAPTLTLNLDSTDGVWTGTATTVTTASANNNPNSGKSFNVLKFTNSTDGTVYIYEPFFTTNGFGGGGGPAGSNLTASTVQAAPSWIATASESPGEMVFGNDGVFDDAASQLDPTTGMALSANQQSALGNIEDQLVAALNRGIADVSFSGDTTTAWTTASNFYPSGHEANAYAAFMHSNAYPTGNPAGQGTAVFVNNQSYAFAYDDQGGFASSFGFGMQSTSQTTLAVTLGPWTGSTPNAIYVRNLYKLLLNRVPEGGAQFWINALNNGMAPAAVVQAIEGSKEYLTDIMTALYQHYLHRAPEGPGLQNWVSALQGGATIETVTASILASPEYFAGHGGANPGFVHGLYQDVLGRTASAGEVQIWVTNLNKGETRAQVALTFLTSNEYYTDLVKGGPWTPFNPETNWGGYYPEFLSHAGSAVEWAYWVNKLAQGATDQVVLAAIFGSAEGYQHRS